MKLKKVLCVLTVIIMALTLLLCGCNQANTKKSVVVFDSDFGTDDAIALLLASDNSSDIFDYIIASQGNATLDGVVQNAITLKTDLNMNATIVRGMPPAPDENVKPAENDAFHGADGLGNMRDKIKNSLKITDEQLGDYIDFDKFTEEMEKFDEIIYISVGPTTNLANLIDNEKIKSKISKAYIMGGGINEFNCNNNTEFNFSKDPQSVKKILNSGLDITLFPLDLTNHQAVTYEGIEELEKGGAYPEFIEFLRFNLQANKLYNNCPTAMMHDSIPVLYHISPESFETQDMKITTDKYGSTKVSDDGALIHVATGVSDDLLKQHMTDAFSK